MGARQPTGDRPVVVYDGGCRFCTRGSRRIAAFDWLGRFDHLPFSEAVGVFPELANKDLEAGMRVRFPDGSVTVGADAVRSIMLRTPAGFLPALILYVPGFHWLGTRAYTWMSRNRHRFGGAQACDTDLN